MFTEDDIISRYTREQALADGVLVDATECAEGAGFKVPVALTRAAWDDCVAWDDEDKRGAFGGQSESGRLWDVVFSAHQAAKKTAGDRASFKVCRVPRSRSERKTTVAELVVVIGPGDAGEPVCTIMEVGED